MIQQFPFTWTTNLSTIFEFHYWLGCLWYASLDSLKLFRKVYLFRLLWLLKLLKLVSLTIYYVQVVIYTQNSYDMVGYLILCLSIQLQCIRVRIHTTVMKGRCTLHILDFIKVWYYYTTLQHLLLLYFRIYKYLNCHSSILNTLRSEDTMENYYNAQVFINHRKS